MNYLEKNNKYIIHHKLFNFILKNDNYNGNEIHLRNNNTRSRA